MSGFCLRGRGKRHRDPTLTSDTSDVVVELLLQSVGGVLLPREVLQVLVEYVVGRPVDFAQVLQELERERERVVMALKIDYNMIW